MHKWINSHPVMPNDDVRHYMALGHTGYIISYRQRNHGSDPDPTTLELLAKESDKRKCNLGVRFVKGVIDAIT